MDVSGPEVRRDSLRRRDGSFSISLRTRWLQRHGMSRKIEIVDLAEGILVRPIRAEATPSIEDQPEFARFLEFLARDALALPEGLVDPEELLEGIDELIDGVEPV